jgi:hypothetical protein
VTIAIVSGAAASSLPKLRCCWVAHHANWLITPADTVLGGGRCGSSDHILTNQEHPAVMLKLERGASVTISKLQRQGIYPSTSIDAEYFALNTLS